MMMAPGSDCRTAIRPLYDSRSLSSVRQKEVFVKNWWRVPRSVHECERESFQFSLFRTSLGRLASLDGN